MSDCQLKGPDNCQHITTNNENYDAQKSDEDVSDAGTIRMSSFEFWNGVDTVRKALCSDEPEHFHRNPMSCHGLVESLVGLLPLHFTRFLETGANGARWDRKGGFASHCFSSIWHTQPCDIWKRGSEIAFVYSGVAIKVV
jgi:hypothetical protein